MIFALLACFHSFAEPMEQPTKPKTILCAYEKMIQSTSESTKDIWDYAYMGDFNLTQKMCLQRGTETQEQIITGLMAIAYLKYREGDEDGMYSIFHNIDRYLDHD